MLKKSKEADLASAQRELERAKAKVLKLRAKQPAVEVQDYVFLDHAGKPVRLSQLFGKKSELILVHNMGTQCRSCTMWGDGFTGQVKHLENRAAFAVESADSPAHQKKFYASRSWNFKMVSSQDSPFKKDMGFLHKGHPMPGVSVFVKKASKIFRTSSDGFGPGDDYCIAWHFFDLLPGGAKGWEPEYRY